MSIFTQVVAVLVAIEFIYIFFLKTIATKSAKTSKVFGLTYQITPINKPGRCNLHLPGLFTDK